MIGLFESPDDYDIEPDRRDLVETVGKQLAARTDVEYPTDEEADHLRALDPVLLDAELDAAGMANKVGTMAAIADVALGRRLHTEGYKKALLTDTAYDALAGIHFILDVKSG